MKILNIFFYFVIFVFVCSSILFVVSDSDYEILGSVKPITIMQYSGFFVFALALERLEGFFLKLDRKVLNFLVIIGFFVSMAVFYEVLWAFLYWFSVFTQSSTTDVVFLDSIKYYPISDFLYDKMSMNWATKHNIFLMFVAIYFTYFLSLIKVRRIIKDRR